jgi:hypothetical protein
LLDDTNRLWRAVVLQALLDAAGLGRSLNPSWPEWKHQQIKKEAIDWLLGGSADFLDVCAAATVPDESIVVFAKRLVRGDARSRELLIEWRDTFAKQGRKQPNGVEVQQESDVPFSVFGDDF